MMVQIKTFQNLQFVAGFFLVFLAGCVTGEQPGDAATGQNAGEYAVRVLLDDNARTVSFKTDSSYKLVSVDTAEGFPAQKTDGTINIEPGEEGIKTGERLFKTKRLIIEPQGGLPFQINNQSYRGSLELIINDDSNSMMVINNVSLEMYLAGVVAAEMPSYWDAEALKAQAIAARTYCLYIKSRFGKNRNWDIRATQANQVYKGVAAETIRTTNAVNSTSGMVLCCEQESGICEQFPAYYSSVCGGHTENAQNVFGESSTALEGVDCPYCRQITKPGLFYWPMATFDKQYATEKIIERYPTLKELGKIEKIEPAKENSYDSTVLQDGLLPRTSNFKRIVSVKLTGSARPTPKVSGRETNEPNLPPAAAKTAYLRAEDMRLAIDSTGAKIQSTSCTIASLKDEFIFVAGRGFGHGVGLCQYGARQMARDGKTAQEILNFYYPNSRIKILY
jgi:stage II sporulation protein D